MNTHDGMVAVIGMAGRFPGAADLDQFWANLEHGVDSLTRYPTTKHSGGSYVPAIGLLADADCFDADFFGCSPKEALTMDPQHRVLLECAWEALENAGYDPGACPFPVGIYAGASQTGYNRLVAEHLDVDEWSLRLATGPDTLTARVAYLLGFTGPAVTIQTACSTSLVAVHAAAQALLAGDCDAALAGGVSVIMPTAASAYRSGGPVSVDGHVRAFDAAASGFVRAEGVGLVVLRRLADALEDGDHIRAVLRGSAVNNDGGAKIGFTAPSVEGQAHVIQAALAVAGVGAETIGYVETHGSATPLGDAVEIAGLTTAFEQSGGKHGHCRLGSVKTNIGHADTAAGIAGLIKTVLALEHAKLPPSLNFQRPNPHIELAGGPFAMNTRLLDWTPLDGVRRAGVSSFGIGGTNAHVVLEEAPPAAVRPAGGRWQLLTVSARSRVALDVITARLARVVAGCDEDTLGDVAWTL